MRRPLRLVVGISLAVVLAPPLGGSSHCEAPLITEDLVADNRDIGSLDTPAWAFFKAGRLDEAGRAATEVLRTGTRHVSILDYAAAMRAALGDHAGAWRLLNLVPAELRGSVRLASTIDKLRAQVSEASQLRPHALTGGHL